MKIYKLYIDEYGLRTGCRREVKVIKGDEELLKVCVEKIKQDFLNTYEDAVIREISDVNFDCTVTKYGKKVRYQVFPTLKQDVIETVEDFESGIWHLKEINMTVEQMKEVLKKEN